MDKEIIMAPSSDGGLLGGGGIGALLIGALLFGGGLGGGLGMGRGGYGTPAASAVASEVVLTPTLNAIQNQISGLQSSQQFGDLSSQVRGDILAVNQSAVNIGSQIANLSTAQAAGNFTTLQSINGLGRDVTAQANQNALQNLNSFNQLNTTTLQGFNNSQFQNAQATNQIIAQGTATASTMATCCCEIKNLIQSDGNLTRALISDLNVQNLRDQLAAANGKVSNNEQNQYLLTTILSHLSPTRVVV